MRMALVHRCPVMINQPSSKEYHRESSRRTLVDNLFTSNSKSSLLTFAGNCTAGAIPFPSSSLTNCTTTCGTDSGASVPSGGSLSASGTPWKSLGRFGGGSSVAIVSQSAAPDALNSDCQIRKFRVYRYLSCAFLRVRLTCLIRRLFPHVTNHLSEERTGLLVYKRNGSRCAVY